MLSFICLFALVAVASAGQLGNPMMESHPLFSNRIVGGVATRIEEVPYQVSIQIDDFHICGGSIIGPRHILTASHCFVGMESEWNYFNVRVGSSYNNAGGQVIKVVRFNSHPDYNPNAHWYSDIGVLELASDIIMSSAAKPVGLPRLASAVPINNYAVASGWGRLTEGGVSPTQLQSVRIPINDPSVCEGAYGSGSFKRNVMVCAASTAGGQSTCQGDSGGPLVYNGVQYGIVSWAQGCARPKYPTVFAHVANLRQFITNVAGI